MNDLDELTNSRIQRDHDPIFEFSFGFHDAHVEFDHAPPPSLPRDFSLTGYAIVRIWGVAGGQKDIYETIPSERRVKIIIGTREYEGQIRPSLPFPIGGSRRLQWNVAVTEAPLDADSLRVVVTGVVMELIDRQQFFRPFCAEKLVNIKIVAPELQVDRQEQDANLANTDSVG